LSSALAPFTVAIIGPDGVGKTTVARALETAAPVPVKYVYMGDNPAAANHTLPTTRWWKSRPRVHEAEAHANGATLSRRASSGSRPARRGMLRTVLRPARKTLGFCNRILEETYRQAVAARFARHGFVVVYDRHFLFDYWFTDVDAAGPRPLRRRLHGQLLQRLQRPPDLVICLDAPGEVVWRRKGEFTPEFLEKRRAQYRSLASRVDHFAVVDANRPLDLVVGDVRDLLREFDRSRNHAAR
jgi:thymidylate kinase